MYDESVGAAAADTATVTKSGEPIVRAIDGVRTHAPVVHVDHRGRVFEVYPEQNDYWTEPVVYAYAFTVRPGQTKGWGLHQEKQDRYTIVSGEVLTILYDARLDSPTHGCVQRVVLTEQGTRQLTIPTGVWHMNVNLGSSEGHLINFPTQPYRHDRPDRMLLPWDTSQIPVDVAGYFPTQSRPPRV